MTTDTARQGDSPSAFTAGGRECRLGGIAKGSGMIHPNMATMLVFLTTDCAIAPELLQKALSSRRATSTFNMVTRRRRHLDQRHGLHPVPTAWPATCRSTPRAPITTRSAKRSHIVTRRLCRADRQGRRGRDQAARMPRDAARAAGSDARKRRQERHLLVPGQGGDVRRRRQLGPRPLRDRLRRRRDVDLERHRRLLFLRRGRGTRVRSRAQASTSREEKAKDVLSADEIQHPRRPARRRRRRRRRGAATSPTITSRSTATTAPEREGTNVTMTQQLPARRGARLQALPYIKKYNGKIVVVKYGGNAMINDDLKAGRDGRHRRCCRSSASQVVLVHGGGPEITETCCE